MCIVYSLNVNTISGLIMANRSKLRRGLLARQALFFSRMSIQDFPCNSLIFRKIFRDHLWHQTKIQKLAFKFWVLPKPGERTKRLTGEGFGWTFGDRQDDHFFGL